MSKLDDYLKDKFSAKRPSTTIVNIKKNKYGMLDELKCATLFLRESFEDPSVNQMLYHHINSINYILLCPECGNPRQVKPYNTRIIGEFYKESCGDPKCEKLIRQKRTEEGITKKYGVKNISQTEEWREKVKKTNLERRGVEWNTQSSELIKAAVKSLKENKDEIVKKREITCKKRYGVEYPSKNKDIINKRRNTNLKKYGHICVLQNDDIKIKSKQTNLKNLGVEHQLQSDITKNKIKKTCIKKYGIDHPMKDSKIFKKQLNNSYKSKNYTLPSGKIVKVQGYEPQALNKLLEKYKESDLIIQDDKIEKKIGKIEYEIDGKNHRYYPDIYIIPENKIIEVKSTYTYQKDLEVNFAKMNACIEAGMSFEFMIIE